MFYFYHGVFLGIMLSPVSSLRRHVMGTLVVKVGILIKEGGGEEKNKTAREYEQGNSLALSLVLYKNNENIFLKH